MSSIVDDLRYHKDPEGLVIVSASLLIAAAEELDAANKRVIELEGRLKELEIQVNRTAKNLLSALHSKDLTVYPELVEQ